MINLLPASEKISLKREEIKKVILILEVIFFLALICFSLILFSIKIYLSAQTEAQKISIEMEEKELLKTEGLQEKMRQINLSLSQLNSFYKSQPQITLLLEGISRILPEGIYLTRFNYLPKNELIEISLSGFAPSREILLEFKEKLGKQEAISEVYFPPITWTKTAHIDWTSNFKIKKAFRLYFLPATNEYQLR